MEKRERNSRHEYIATSPSSFRRRSVATAGLPGDLVLAHLQERHRSVGGGGAGAIELAAAIAVHGADVRGEVRGLGLEIPGEGAARGAHLHVAVLALVVRAGVEGEAPGLVRAVRVTAVVVVPEAVLRSLVLRARRPGVVLVPVLAGTAGRGGAGEPTVGEPLVRLLVAGRVAPLGQVDLGRRHADEAEDHRNRGSHGRWMERRSFFRAEFWSSIFSQT